jgi:hypothetical protein
MKSSSAFFACESRTLWIDDQPGFRMLHTHWRFVPSRNERRTSRSFAANALRMAFVAFPSVSKAGQGTDAQDPRQLHRRPNSSWHSTT